MYGHRYVYIQKYGKIKDQVIRHTCDNKWCINPEHLIQGSHSDNVKDRVVRNRSAKGINNGRSKLSEESVINIFNDNTTPKTLLAKKFDIDPKVIRDIKNKVKWKYLTKKL